MKAQMIDNLVLIQMDANRKLGPTIIAGDPHPQSANRKLLANIVERNALIVVNSLPDIGSGVITRKRFTEKIKEQSIIDFVIVCEDMLNMVESLLIDEDNEYPKYWDKIFVLNAILNQVVRQKLKGIDVTIYDVMKCFDKLWTKECINDLYVNGLTNDTLYLLHLSNIDAKVAVKIPRGMTERFTLKENILQGTVWGSLKFTCTMDSLAKEQYKKKLNHFIAIKESSSLH